MERFLPPAARSSPILSAFQHWDTPGNARISREKLIAVLHRLGVDADDAEKVLSRAGTADRNNIDYHQFVAYLYCSGTFDGFRLVQKQIEHERNRIEAAKTLASNAAEEEAAIKSAEGGVEADEKLKSVASALACYAYEVLPEQLKEKQELAGPESEEGMPVAAACLSYDGPPKQMEETRESDEARASAEEHALGETDAVPVATAIEDHAVRTTEEDRVAAEATTLTEAAEALARFSNEALPSHLEAARALSALAETHNAEEAVAEANESFAAEENRLREGTAALAAAKEASLKAAEDEELEAEENQLSEETATLAAAEEAVLKAEQERLAAEEKTSRELAAPLASFTFEILPQQREEESREKETLTALASTTAAEETAWKAEAEEVSAEPHACASEGEAMAAEEAPGAAEMTAATSEYDGGEASQKIHEGWDQEKAETVDGERAAEENAVSKANECVTSVDCSAEVPAQEVQCVSLVLEEEATCNRNELVEAPQAPKVNKSKPNLQRCDSMYTNRLAPVALFVTLVGARNLRNADWSWLGQGVSDPYCVCEIVGKMVGKFQTQTIDNNLNPSWNEVWEVRGFAKGDELRISVYDRDSESGKDDDFLGEILLTDSHLCPSGFTGELPLHKAGSAEARIILDIKVVMPPDDQEEEDEEDS
eukprot:TRINITY_DN31880_c0_g2_i1.p1 TRINITY_DN31880_c0_g2~~TRINITY_DN31880_c0_g2_i1.p1  ORF type:complete len:659 (+),score=192.13 TRINITY_DN31880_c0_g2_i1:35-2011(+)